jgi:hypothetical protein
MVADSFGEQQDGSVGLTRLTQGQLTYQWDSNSLIQQYASVLNAYKKYVF